MSYYRPHHRGDSPITKLDGSARPSTADEAQRALRDVGADIDLRSIVDSWEDTLDDKLILELLRNWNAGRPLFQTIYASAPPNAKAAARARRGFSTKRYG